MVNFDPTISAGSLVDLVALAVAALVVIMKNHWKIDAMEKKLDSMANVLVTLARQDERIKAHEGRLARQETAVDELRHGRGFVFEQPFAGKIEG